MSNELTNLFPTGKEVSIQAENLTIKPFKFGELPKVFKLVTPMAAALSTLQQNRDNPATAIAGLIANGGDSILDLMVIGSHKPREWIDNLDMDEGATLLTAILEVNADFFIQKVLPVIMDTASKVKTVSGQT